MIQIDGKKYGISNNGNWVVGCQNSEAFEASPDKSMVFFFPFLEHSIEKIQTWLDKEITKKNLPQILAKSFPYEALILSALSSESFYWTRLSLD